MNDGSAGITGVEGMDVPDTIKTYVVENFLFGDDSRIGPETDFLENGILDSTGVLELVGFLEEKFGIRVEDDEVVPDNMNSIEKISLYISKKTGKTQPA
jgi:acyl carrier protein